MQIRKLDHHSNGACRKFSDRQNKSVRTRPLPLHILNDNKINMPYVHVIERTLQGGTSRCGKDPSTIPGWTNTPAHKEHGDLLDVISKGGVYKYLDLRHEGGRRPIVAFTWKDKKVVSVCSPEAYKDMQKLTNRPGT